MPTASVHIYQPYLPRYRMRFFSRLRDELASTEVALSLLHGSPCGSQAARSDAATLDWAMHMPMRNLRMGRRQLSLPRRGSRDAPADLAIFEQALSNGAAWRALLGRRCDQRIALWGHGEILTRSARAVESKVLRSMTARSDWFFAYTDLSSRFVASTGFPHDRITVVNNTVDTESLARAASESGHGARNHALFLGAIDETKDLDFLLRAAHTLSHTNPRFVLDIVGEGVRRRELQDQVGGAPWVRFHGAIHDPQAKADLARRAGFLVISGRVGLACVEGFALGLPVIATDYAHSAPERAYLVHGTNALITGRDQGQLVSVMNRLLQDEGLRHQLACGAHESAGRYSLNNMVANFADGVRAALAMRPRRGASRCS